MAEGVSPVARREVLCVAGWRIFRAICRNREELWFDPCATALQRAGSKICLEKRIVFLSGKRLLLVFSR